MGFEDVHGGVVEVRLPARPELIPLLRTVTADLAARADFDLDAVADLRMAVDEAAATLVQRATADQELRCRFVVAADHIEIAVSTPSDSPVPTLDTGGFGWRILQTLLDEVTQHPAPPEDASADAPPRLGIRLVKKGPAV